MLITATELKNNIGKYLALAELEDIFITKNGKSVAKLSSVRADKMSILESLVGIIPDSGMRDDDIRGERLKRQ